VFRILRFSVNLQGTPTIGNGKIALDWPAWLALWDYAEDVDELGLLSVFLDLLSLVLALF